MRTSILASFQPIALVPNPPQETSFGSSVNRKLDPRNDPAIGNFRTALDNADAGNLPKINNSGVSLVKLAQRTPVAISALDQSAISTSIKDPGVTAAATGASVRETASRGVSSAGHPVPVKGELAPAPLSFGTTILPSAGPAMLDPSLPPMQLAPAPMSPSSSPGSEFPVTQPLEPEADPGTPGAATPQNVKPSSRPVHMKNNARADTDPDPAGTDRTAEPSHDVTAVIMVPPAPYVPVTAPALLATVATSSQTETSPRPLDGSSRLPDTQPAAEGEPVVVPDTTYNDVASSGKSGSNMNAVPESHIPVASGSRQILALPRVADVMEPLRRRFGSGAIAQSPSTTTSAGSVVADTAASAAVNGAQVDPAQLLPRDILPPVRVAASILAGDHAQAAVQQVTPALVSLVTHSDGSNELTVSLHPHELGQVEVHLVRGSNGTTAITIMASNPVTLQELSQNAHHLHAALDAASVPVDGRTMNFIMASAVTAEQNQNSFGRSAPSLQDSSGGTSGGQDQKPWQNHQNSSANDTVDDTATHRDLATVATRRSWQLSGLNITA